MSTKTLISWIAVKNDFDRETNEVREDGPTANYHRYFWKYDRHILLYNHPKYESHRDFLENYLKRTFSDHQVETRLIEIQDILDLQEVYAKTERLLMEYREDTIDIFFSPGAPMMQLSWYLCHNNFNLNTRLIQLKEARFSKSKKPEQIVLDIGHEGLSGNVLIKQLALEGKKENDYLITDSINPVYELAFKVAQADHVRVMVYGESGTGKEHLAHYIHQNSPRKSRTYRSVNCAALSDDLLGSTLFGHKKGSFTGAHLDRKGLFDICDGGTIFLDEIGDISSALQQALLRVIQEGEIWPIGGTKPKKVDVRIVAATNRNLPKLCEEGSFRWDLYYRLAVFELELLSLNERGPKEVEEMLDFFLKTKKKLFRRSKQLKLSKEVRHFLKYYTWPGNIRELENVVEHLYVYGEESLTLSHIPKRIREIPPQFSEKWQDVEAEHLRKLFKRYEGNKRRVWQAVGYGSINTLMKKLDEHGIS